MNETRLHYDLLIDEGNDPVLDPPELRAYMDKWDGDTLIDELGLTGNEDVLEIGVGSGRLAVRVMPRCRYFCGIDISEKTAERAREHLSGIGSYFSVVCEDFLHWNSERAFDQIYSSLTFIHIEDKSRGVRKAAEMLVPGGRFVLSCEKNGSDEIDYGTRKIRIYPDDPGLIRKALTDAGLDLIHITETEFAVIYTAEKRVTTEEAPNE